MNVQRSYKEGLPKPQTIALVGDPNSGKTTLFNALTGSQQRTGNWPRSTVERREGHFNLGHQAITIVDLPGIYSLVDKTHSSEQNLSGLDERITCHYIASGEFEGLINVVDACALERHLYLTLQLLKLKCPMIVVINRIDLAKQRGIKIEVDTLSQGLGCPVVTTDAKHRIGLEAFKSVLLTKLNQNTKASNIAADQQERKHYVLPKADDVLSQAQGDYQQVDHLLSQAMSRSQAQPSTVSSIDRVLLSRVWGIPCFLLMMSILFALSIDVGGVFQDFFDIASASLFIKGLTHCLEGLHAPIWLITLLADGVGQGINTVMTFIPVLAVLFFCLSWLEESGYMVRAAFVMDRVMRVIGLPGKSFVPMMIGLGCNVPSVMATRTLENPMERIATIMMLPFMSCGARLAIYAVFVAAFFPGHGGAIIFLLYLTGLLMALLTGWVLKKWVLPGQACPLVLELPCYQWPSMTTVLQQMWQRLSSFILRAGQLIIPVCIFIKLFNIITVPGELLPIQSAASTSLLAYVGQWLTPLLAPMGIHANNWPATIGLLTGIFAKEVMIGSLNALYSSGVTSVLMPSHHGISIGGEIYTALLSIKTHMMQLPSVFLNPLASVKEAAYPLSTAMYGKMAHAFDGPVGVFAYLLFILLYFPCVSTVAVIMRELNRAWACFSVVWSTGLAYAVAVSFYQLAKLPDHPLISLSWVVAVWGSLAMVLAILKYSVSHSDLKVFRSGEKNQHSGCLGQCHGCFQSSP